MNKFILAYYNFSKGDNYCNECGHRNNNLFKDLLVRIYYKYFHKKEYVDLVKNTSK